MLKRLTFLPLLLLAGCVTHYHTPPQTVIYRDVHGLTSGAYDTGRDYVAPGVTGSVASYVYYPWWSMDYFYLGHGYGYGPRYGSSFSFSWSSGWPSYGLSWSSGYGWPGPWYGYYYDPWYCPPWRAGWYAPYRHYRGYGGYAWNSYYWRDRYDRYDRYHRAGYRDHGDGRGYGSGRNGATLDPDWRNRDGGLRQDWRGDGPGEDRATPGMRGVTDSTRSAARVAMPSSAGGDRTGMAVRSRSGAKSEVTRPHSAPAVAPSREVRQASPDTSRSVRYIAGSPSARSPSAVSSVRHKAEAKQAPTRAHRAKPVDRGVATTRPELIPIAPAPGRVVTPSRPAPARSMPAPSSWRPSSGAPSRPAPSFQSPPARISGPAPKSGKGSGDTRPHRSEKSAAGSRRGGEKAR